MHRPFALSVSLLGIILVPAAAHVASSSRPPAAHRVGHTTTIRPDGALILVGGRGEPAPVEVWAEESRRPFEALLAPRSEHTATLLPGGRVLVVGGLEDARGADLLDPFSGEMTAAAALLPEPRIGHTATLLRDGSVLVLGGRDMSDRLVATGLRFDPRSVDGRFDPALGAFHAAAPGMREPRADHTATMLSSGLVLVAGGRTEGGETATIELIDPAAGTATTFPVALRHERAGHTATLLPDGDVLIAGGMAGGEWVSAVERIHVGEERISPAGELQRTNHAAVLTRSGVLVTGGDAGPGSLERLILPLTGRDDRCRARRIVPHSIHS